MLDSSVIRARKIDVTNALAQAEEFHQEYDSKGYYNADHHLDEFLLANSRPLSEMVDTIPDKAVLYTQDTFVQYAYEFYVRGIEGSSPLVSGPRFGKIVLRKLRVLNEDFPDIAPTNFASTLQAFLIKNGFCAKQIHLGRVVNTPSSGWVSSQGMKSEDDGSARLFVHEEELRFAE